MKARTGVKRRWGNKMKGEERKKHAFDKGVYSQPISNLLLLFLLIASSSYQSSQTYNHFEGWKPASGAVCARLSTD